MMEMFLIGALGLIFGSFITCASYRLPLDQDVVRKPSYCPSCNTKLGFADLFPVFSWLMSGGKCRHCKAKISLRYPLIEMVTAALFVLVYLQFGLTPMAIVVALMTVALMVMIVADLEHFIIPDSVHLALLPLALAYHYVAATPIDTVIYGLALGAAIGLSLHYGYRYLRHKEGLGFGDVKFFAVAGLWLGAIQLVPFMFFSGLLGVIFGLIWRLFGKGPVFPFGPALAVSLFVCIAYPETTAWFWTAGGLIGR